MNCKISTVHMASVMYPLNCDNQRCSPIWPDVAPGKKMSPLVEDYCHRCVMLWHKLKNLAKPYNIEASYPLRLWDGINTGETQKHLCNIARWNVHVRGERERVKEGKRGEGGREEKRYLSAEVLIQSWFSNAAEPERWSQYYPWAFKLHAPRHFFLS